MAAIAQAVWIKKKQNVVEYKGRKVTWKDNGFLKHNSKVLKSFNRKNKNCFKANKNPITQLYFAKKGIITPEMEFIAIRENQKLQEINQITLDEFCKTNKLDGISGIKITSAPPAMPAFNAI